MQAGPIPLPVFLRAGTAHRVLHAGSGGEHVGATGGRLDAAAIARHDTVMVVFRLLVALFAAVGIGGASAQTPDPDLPPVDPPGHWRQMTLDDATSDSKCVGKFDTPLCAVETVIACFARSHRELCNEALRKPDYFERSHTGRPPDFRRMLYRIERSEILTQEGIDEIPRHADIERPGDLRIDVSSRDCYRETGGENCTFGYSDPNIFTLRKTEGRWIVLHWGTLDPRMPKRG